MFGNTSLKRSRPDKNGELHGVEIKKYPIGKYLDFIQTLKGSLPGYIGLLFSGKSYTQIIDDLSRGEFGSVTNIIFSAPEIIFNELANFLAITPEYLRDNMSPAELTEVIARLWEVNDLSSFFQNVRLLLKVNGMKKAGFRAG